mmetsp:Transcript_14481/g.26662  ORF Transcript_14481/g.26662 Transcript_14481/m.26662 type:complete len:128 (+) Transcript_14481:63-446(+)
MAMLRRILAMVLIAGMADVCAGDVNSNTGPLAVLKDVLQHGLSVGSSATAGDDLQDAGDGGAPSLKELKAVPDGNSTNLDTALSMPENPKGTVVRVTLNSELQESEAQTSSDRRASNLRQAQAGTKL